MQMKKRLGMIAESLLPYGDKSKLNAVWRGMLVSSEMYAI